MSKPSKRAFPPLLGAALAIVLAAGAGCDAGEPDCACAPRAIDFGTVQSVEDTLEATFTVENVGDGDRLSWFIEPLSQFGLSVREPSLYVLDSGEEMTYTLVFAPQDSISDQTVAYRVGLGDCVLSVTLGAYDSPEPGACCLPDGSCVGGLLRGECEGERGGTFQGEGTACASVDCPQPPPPVCRLSTDALDFVFTLETVSQTLRDTVTVYNDGGEELVGSVTRFNCSSVSLAPLENFGTGLAFSLAPGDSAKFEVAVTISTNTQCAIDVVTNATGANRCDPVILTSRFQAGALQRARH